MTEDNSNLARIRAVRGGNRAVITKLINEAKALLDEEQLNRGRLSTITELLDEKSKIVKGLDEKILDVCEVGDIQNEIEAADELYSRVLDVQRDIKDRLNDEATKPLQENAAEVSQSPIQASETTIDLQTQMQTSGHSSEINIEDLTQADVPAPEEVGPPINNVNNNATIQYPQSQSKLPKLVLPKFKGDITLWKTFWDSFCSAVHNNKNLTSIDKFNHLNSLLEGQAKRCIQGLSLSEQNYEAATELLRQRFGNPQLVISTHMDELLKIPACVGDKVSQLRFVYDKISVNVRGLEALGVRASQYGSLLIPVVMSKLPQDIRLQIARKTSKEVWEISEILDVIRNEVEAREMSDGVKVVQSDKSKFPSKPPSLSTFLVNNGPNKPNIKCVYCSGDHYSASCAKVADKSSRLEILRKDRRCFVCLMVGHTVAQCDRKRCCRRCQGKHHQSICEHSFQTTNQVLGNPVVRENNPFNQNPRSNSFNPPDTSTSQQVQPSTTQTPPQQITTTCAKTSGGVILQTATATAVSEDGSKTTCVKILFDNGSQRSYISENLKSKLGLKSKGTEALNLNTFGEKKFRKQRCELLELKLRASDGNDVVIKALKFPVICSPISATINLEHHPHLIGIPLADKSKIDDPIDILIGSDFYWDIVGSEMIRAESGPVAISSKFGWLLSGPTSDVKDTSTVATNLVISGGSTVLFDIQEDPVVKTLKQFWETESVGIKSCERYDDSTDTFNENVRFNGERYETVLPWKNDMPQISSDFDLCSKRLKSLQRKLLNQPELLREYDEIIRDQERAGIIEQIPDADSHASKDCNIHYLPHHAVVRSDHDTTKLRIVYDGSAKTPDREYSMNDCLETGPNFTPQLIEILLRFRWYNVGLTGDIEKAFLMIGITESDRDRLRFLWLKDPSNLNSETVQFRFTRLVFGLRPSPAILGSTIRHHLDTQKDASPALIEVLRKSFYVDDFISGANDDDEALELAVNAKTIMQKGSFNLRKWNTNSSTLQENLPQPSKEAASASSSTNRNFTEDDQSYSESVTGNCVKANENSVKVLGSIWNKSSDKLQFDLTDLAVQVKSLPATKRSLLKVIGKIFDPLGFLSPFVIRWKVLFQVLCTEQVDWDCELNEEQLQLWDTLTFELEHLNHVCVPRCYFLNNGLSRTIQLHCFSDASRNAYAAAVYIRSCYGDGFIDVNLVVAKTRVAPLHQQTIPRLELLGANILARLSASVKNALNLPDGIMIFYWIDSMTVLYWIKNNKPWKQYVMSRVKEIRELTSQESWRHCPGKQNPADLPSRGSNASELVNEIQWWKGPCFLYKSEAEWPKTEATVMSEEATAEEVKNPVTQTHVMTTVQSENEEPTANIQAIMDCNRYSSKTKLLRVTALVRRFVKLSTKRGTQVDAEEMRDAEILWLKSVQSTVFKHELKLLNKGREKNQLIKQLNMFTDENGIIRCQGRIDHSGLPVEAQRPILLPAKHRFTELVIEEAHHTVHHNGIRETLNRIREKYWVLRGRESVKGLLKKCVVCKKLEGKPFSTPPAPVLPESRVSDEPPFAYTGLDFAGPLLTSDNGKAEKSYISLFTCASTRAVHLELLKNMSAKLFLLAFRRFVSRRGLPRKLISDNAKTFKAAAKEIRTITRGPNVERYLTNQGVTWDFISEKAPWHGGMWERMVRSVKRCLKKSLGRTSLTFEELETILIEIEATLNSRPLTYIYDEQEGVSYPLTPSCLINGRRIPTTPNDVQFEISCTNKSLTKRARYQNRVLKSFTDQWKKEYLLSLRESSRSESNQRESLSVGDVVILKDANQPRTFWKLAKIETLLPSKDGIIRSVMVKVLSNDKKKTTLLRRPIQQLVPLEIRSKI